MRAVQKLVRNGNSTQITIPRSILIHLGWIQGQLVVLDVLEDKSIVVRVPCERDFAPPRLLPTVYLDPPTVKP